MKVDFLSQAGKILKEHKQYKRRLAVFLCLAVIVTFGTVTALKLYGQAMTHKKEVLDCKYEVHEHTDECYERDEEGNLGTEPVCGYADYVIHVHNDGCYGADGSLTCALEEHKPHEHTDECYVTEMILVCGEESAEDKDGLTGADGTGTPAEGTDGTDSSADDAGAPADGAGAADGEGAPAEGTDGTGTSEGGADPETQSENVCGIEEHKHDESCYENMAVCAYPEEHTHEDGCLQHELECTIEEHTHTEECYDEEGNLICEKEEHGHIIGCFDVNGNLFCKKEIHVHGDGCLDGEGNLICGMEEHDHITGCYRNSYICGKEVHTHEESCFENVLICELEEHEHTEACYTVTGGNPAGEEGSAPESAEPEENGAPSETPEAGSEDNAAPEGGTGDNSDSSEGTAAGENGADGNVTGGHVHTEACYQEVTTLVCGEQELHTHDDSCYDEDCFDEDGNLIEGSRVSCGLLQLEEHRHTEDCYKVVELTPEEVAALENGAKLHIHTEDCYDGEGNLICGHDATHIHKLECYDDAGKLICGYGTASHVHDDSCYDEVGNRVCGYETAVHVHNESCVDTEGNLICGYLTASHVHDENCLDEEGNLICGYETASHIHRDICYDEEGNLICGYLTAAHVHDESCVDEEGNLICGYETAEEHEHDAYCYDTKGHLLCGYSDARDHEHKADCYNTEGELICGYRGVRDHEHDAGCYNIYNELICGYEGAEDHVHTDSCYGEEGELICGYELPEIFASTRVVTGESYIVVVRYNEDANIPEEADLLVEEITADSNKEHYERRETEYREMLEDEAASMRALLKIGFYIEEEGAQVEIEPEAPVTISVQFLDEDGLPEGSPVTVIHFAEEGTEVLDGGSAVDNSTTFRMSSFSEIAIGYIAEEDPRDLKEAEDGTVRLYLDDTFEYKDDAFQIIFHIEGEAILPPGSEIAGGNPTESDTPKASEAVSGSAEPTKPKEPEDFEDATEPGDAAEAVDTEESADAAEPDAALDPEGGNNASGEESPESAGNETGGTQTSGTENAGTGKTAVPRLRFKVEKLDVNSEEYAAFIQHVEERDGTDSLYRLQVMTYTLTYGGEELDLSRCKVTAEIRPAEKLEEELEKSVPEAAAYLLNSNGEIIQNEMEITPDVLPYRAENDEDGETDEGIDTVPSYTDPESEEGAFPEPQVTAVNPDDLILNGEDVISFTVSIQAANGELVDLAMKDYNSVDEEGIGVDLTGVQLFSTRASGQPNPKFTVQYYANLTVVAYNDPSLRKVIGSTSYTNELPVIDTTGGKLPANGGGTTASPNGNEIRNLYVDMSTGKLQTKTELTEVYSSRPFEYHKAPTINYMNALVENTSYELKEVWVLKEGKKADSTYKSDWDIYTYSADLHFTNRAVSAESGEYVLISDGATLRFVYDTTDNDNKFEAAFYDYDIGDGMIYSTQLNAQKQTNGKPTSTQGEGTYHMHTNQSGINSPGNYTGSGAKLAFGNANTGSGLQHELWGGNLLNKHNGTQGGHPSVTGSYKGCTFGLVTGLVDGKVQYAGNVNAPNLFNDGAAAGKTSYDNGEFSLTFNRVGDTYTLTTVNGTRTSGLDTFNHPSPNASTVHNHIWTNNFWPMDSAASFGTDGHDMKFGNYTNRENYKFAGQAGSSGGSAAANGTFPWSDDGEDHNSYFGMHYNVEFDLVEDYVGPLEYYFFGDDDMWVFLDGKLVCDIGGVHSSVGEYVNLWDYLEKGSEESAGKHTLSFFYTERGESGSTCWMQFTLPTVSSLTPETSDEDYGHLKIEKTVTQVSNGVETTVDNNDEFTFTVHFTDANGKNLPDDYSYVKYDKDGNEIGSDLIIWDGGEFTLKNGEYIIVKFLPQGTKYKITEANAALTVTDNISETSKTDYFTDITVGGTLTDDKKDLTDDKIAEGEISKNSTAEVKYNNKFYLYGLPETGGTGSILYTMAGGIVLLFGAGFMYRKNFREGRGKRKASS